MENPTEIRNIPEAKALVILYRSITEEHLKRVSLQGLTGFNSKNTCSLCKAVMIKFEERDDYIGTDCNACIYSFGEPEGQRLYGFARDTNVYCLNEPSAYTYSNLLEAHDAFMQINDSFAPDIIQALKDRAAYIEDLIKRIEGEV